MNLNPSVLIVDDDGEAVISLARALRASGLQSTVHVASTAPQALDLFKLHHPEVVIMDLSLEVSRGVESGFQLLGQVVGADSTTRVIVLTGHGSIEHGVRALTLGASNFLEKPADIAHVRALIHDGIGQASLRREYEKLLKATEREISSVVVGGSQYAEKLREAILYAGKTSQSVLIVGETGTGKGLCASAIHSFGVRKAGTFVRYQPNFSSADLANSDLFGHTKGAFTGALDNRQGLVAMADGGTLFLDEVDEVPAELQVALLGVLQERMFRRVGSSKDERSDFRLVCATNRPIEQALSEGKLRKDFYHRIAAVTIEVPPLRARIEDVEELSISSLAKIRSREHFSVQGFDSGALRVLKHYSWPGNIRELEGVVEAAAYRAHFGNRVEIRGEDIALPQGNHSQKPIDFLGKVEQFKYELITEALLRSGGNQVKAAEELGLDRTSLRRIIARNTT